MSLATECWFDHEKLDVYRESVAFVAWLSQVLDATVRIGDVKDQLDRASTLVPLNIAEGNGKYAPKDRCRFFDIAHGSALECAAGLDILVAKAKLTEEQVRPGKEKLQKIVRMLFGLIKRNSTREYERGEHAKPQPMIPTRNRNRALNPLPNHPLHPTRNLLFGVVS
jgi:four helix bundle protein